MLAQYEPVLRFAKSERFFPMAVEPYLEKCHILPSGPQGVVGLLVHLNEPRASQIGKLHGREYYLRFVNDPLIDSDVWVWWGALSVVALGVGWFVSGWMGVGGVLALSVIAALSLLGRGSRKLPAVAAVAPSHWRRVSDA